jgi:hypothetical protein
MEKDEGYEGLVEFTILGKIIVKQFKLKVIPCGFC